MTAETKTPPRALRILDNHKGRRCGTCTACCTANAVAEIGKAAGAACPHRSLDSNRPGCGIYAERPTGCQTFRCVWLDGVGPDKHRPDRIGVVIGVQENPGLPVAAGVPGLIGETLNGHRRALVAVEVWKGAATTTARQILLEIADAAPLAVIPFGKG